jgi:hypothetical protein
MTTFLVTTFLASVYGAGGYNANNYNGTDAVSAGGAAASGGSLSNTGILIGLIVGISALLALIAMMIRIWRRPKRAIQPTE